MLQSIVPKWGTTQPFQVKYVSVYSLTKQEIKGSNKNVAIVVLTNDSIRIDGVPTYSHLIVYRLDLSCIEHWIDIVVDIVLHFVNVPLHSLPIHLVGNDWLLYDWMLMLVLLCLSIDEHIYNSFNNT